MIVVPILISSLVGLCCATVVMLIEVWRPKLDLRKTFLTLLLLSVFLIICAIISWLIIDGGEKEKRNNSMPMDCTVFRDVLEDLSEPCFEMILAPGHVTMIYGATIHALNAAEAERDDPRCGVVSEDYIERTQKIKDACLGFYREMGFTEEDPVRVDELTYIERVTPHLDRRFVLELSPLDVGLVHISLLAMLQYPEVRAMPEEIHAGITEIRETCLVFYAAMGLEPDLIQRLDSGFDHVEG